MADARPGIPAKSSYALAALNNARRDHNDGCSPIAHTCGSGGNTPRAINPLDG